MIYKKQKKGDMHDLPIKSSTDGSAGLIDDLPGRQLWISDQPADEKSIKLKRFCTVSGAAQVI